MKNVLQAFNNENVHLETDGIESIKENSIITKAGKEYKFGCFAFCRMATVMESTAHDGSQRET